MLKYIPLILVYVSLFTSCSKDKEEPIPFEPLLINVDSVDYSVQAYHWDPKDNFDGCVNSFNFKYTIVDDTIALVNIPSAKELLLHEDSIDFRKFVLVDKGPGTWYDHHYELTIYNCDDRVKYARWNSYNDAYDRYISVPSDTINCALIEPLYCNSGPEESFCFTSRDRSLSVKNYQYFRNVVIVTDSINLNQLITFTDGWDIEFPSFNFRLPIDPSFAIIPGDYFIGTVPSGSYPIIDCYSESTNGSIAEFANFASGKLTIDQVGSDLIFSWVLYGCNESIWTGYTKISP